MLNFFNLSIISAALAAAIAACLFIFPQLYFVMFAVASSEPAFFIGRRLGVLFLGFALVSFVSRNASHSKARQAICIGIGVAMACMAGLGLFEVVRGFAGVGTYLAAAVELAVAVAYLWVWYDSNSIEQAD